MSYQWRDLQGALVDGKFRLVEYLGEVANNGVFATEPVDGHAAIVRIAPGETAEGSRALEQWRSATTLTHPQIARTYAAGSTELDAEPVVYTVTERPDDSLAEAVRHRALTESEGRDLAASVLGALEYLHGRGFAHHAVSPENIVAMADKIKLAPWTIGPATQTEMSQDVFAAGQTIAEVLTQQRPSSAAALPPNLPRSFTALVRACMGARLSAADALKMLMDPASATPPRRAYKLPTAALVAAALAVLLLVYVVRGRKPAVDEPVQSRAPLPSPVEEVRGRTTPAPPAQAGKGDWAVVAAIYKQYDQALARAEQIAGRWKQWQPEVFPPQQPNGRRYMIVLGFAESRKEAEQLLAKARAAGMPRDVYVTRVKR